MDLGGKPVTMSDSGGYIYDESGIDRQKLAWIMDLKNNKRGRIKEYADHFDGVDYTQSKPEPNHNELWATEVDVALLALLRMRLTRQKLGCWSRVE